MKWSTPLVWRRWVCGRRAPGEAIGGHGENDVVGWAANPEPAILPHHIDGAGTVYLGRGEATAVAEVPIRVVPVRGGHRNLAFREEPQSIEVNERISEPFTEYGTMMQPPGCTRGWPLSPSVTRANLVAAMAAAADTGRDRVAVGLAGFLSWRREWDDGVMVAQVAAGAAERMQDPRRYAGMLTNLGLALHKVRRRDGATAATIYREPPTLPGMAGRS
jgi:hypothetical protein